MIDQGCLDVLAQLIKKELIICFDFLIWCIFVQFFIIILIGLIIQIEKKTQIMKEIELVGNMNVISIDKI